MVVQGASRGSHGSDASDQVCISLPTREAVEGTGVSHCGPSDWAVVVFG